ncbi:hypothetical protein [Streptomyces cylindrosporus]|uniref:Uncharacterized protein n=1 Tax=Streptomyces cylindrosporus TaxID=2927583 RepID=A0ABS9YPX6_9ACTN|nr:hypothetical protein [Streptomyces cylindrosporus]MCI3279189.1 hypothetical protein [Streptomyces cylindrosporus]
MSAARILGSAYPVLLLVALLVVAVVGGVLAVRRERKSPSSYELPEPAGDLAWWAALPTESQAEMDDLVLGPGARLRQTPQEAVQERLEAADRAFLDPAAQAALDEEDAAREAAQRLAQVNALYHP